MLFYTLRLSLHFLFFQHFFELFSHLGFVPSFRVFIGFLAPFFEGKLVLASGYLEFLCEGSGYSPCVLFVLGNNSYVSAEEICKGLILFIIVIIVFGVRCFVSFPSFLVNLPPEVKT